MHFDTDYLAVRDGFRDIQAPMFSAFETLIMSLVLVTAHVRKVKNSG